VGGALVELLPAALGLALTPAAIVLAVLLLQTTRPVANVLAFATAFAVVYGASTAVVLTASATADEPLLSVHTKDEIAAGVGGLLLVLAVVGFLRGRRRGGPPRRPKLKSMVESARPASAFGLGTVLAIVNPNLAILAAGLTTVVAAGLATGAQITLGTLLVLASEIGILGPLAWFLLRRRQAEHALAGITDWLGRNEHAVDLAVLAVFGLVFTVKGLAGLV